MFVIVEVGIVEVLQIGQSVPEPILEPLCSGDRLVEQVLAVIGESAHRCVSRGEQRVRRRRRHVLAVGLFEQLAVDPLLTPMHEPGLLKTAGHLVRGLHADVGSSGHRRSREIRVEVEMPSPRLVHYDQAAVAAAADHLGDLLGARGESLVGGRRVNDRDRLRMAVKRLSDLLRTRRMQGLEPGVVRRGQKPEADVERLDRVDDRVVDVACDQDHRVRLDHCQHPQEHPVRPGGAVHAEHRAVGSRGQRGELLGLFEDTRVVSQGAEEPG